MSALDEVERRWFARQAEAKSDALEALRSFDGGGTLPPMETVDAKIAASEARTDTKFAELRGDLKDFATKGTVWTAMATAVAIIVAMLAFAGDRLALGVGLADQRQEQLRRDDAQDKKFDEILARLPKPTPSLTATPKR